MDPDTIISRARQRDVAWLGSAEIVEHSYRTRVLPTHALYTSLINPEAHADAVIDTQDLNAPRLERLGYAPVLSDGVVVVDGLTLADAYTHWDGEDDEHARRFGWYPRRSTLDGVRAFILQGQRQWREGGPRRTLALRLEDTRTLVGGCETRLQPDGTAEVSWWTFPERRRRGLATRGVRLMLEYFSNTLRISKFVALIERDNYASLGVARNAGFIDSGLDTSGPSPMLRHERWGRLPRRSAAYDFHRWVLVKTRSSASAMPASAIHRLSPRLWVDRSPPTRTTRFLMWTCTR